MNNFYLQPKLFSVIKKGYGKSQLLNDVIAAGGINDLIYVQEALQEKKIAEIAEQIAYQKGLFSLKKDDEKERQI